MNLKSVSDIQHSFGCVVAEKVFKDFHNLLFTHKNKHFQHSYMASTVNQNSSVLGVAIV